ncbi:hypothetical protein BOX15_Mlig016079g4 [Macrostomum lignano]|uniref:18 kDa Sin3-associated polypeptide n=2 Tax=Macrostomum lignano TaxID=282301 RepID=A0A1I8G8Z9_9PLAT|nr:hypothetical protein BOX15_Mlig016079g4 [Macrostomum lignano]
MRRRDRSRSPVVSLSRRGRRSRSPPPLPRNRDRDRPRDRQPRGVDQKPLVESNKQAIDREKTCPLLLRVFCSIKRHHSLTEFTQGRTPSNELQIYTWMDATLKELSQLVQEVNPDSRAKGTYFDFAVVYPDLQTTRYKSRDIGTVRNGTRGMDDNVTLKDRRFRIGDYLDISICPDERTGGDRDRDRDRDAGRHRRDDSRDRGGGRRR